MGHLENLEDILLNLPVMPENARDVLGNAIDERDALRAEVERLGREVDAADLSLAGLLKARNAAIVERDAAQAEVTKLQAFKAYVHERLDKMGIPVDPPGEHRDAGCRVGQRLDVVEAALDASTPVAPVEPTWNASDVKEEVVYEFGTLLGPRTAAQTADRMVDRMLARLAATRGEK